MKDLGGYVTNPNSFTRTLKPTPDGIYSQKIFGPILDYRCECGRLNHRGLAGTVCSTCGVICESSDLRYKTFGKIKLPFPVLKPTKKSKFEKILGFKPSFDSQLYLLISDNGQALRMVDRMDSIPDGFRLVPAGVTGYYSLYLILRYLADLGVPDALALIEGGILVNELLVIPPGVRPFSKIKRNGELQVVLPPLSEKYNRILRLNKGYESMARNSKDDEDNFICELDKLFQEQVTDQVLIRDYILNYETISGIYQNLVEDVYQAADKMVFRKEGLIRSSMLARTIEFSARAVVVSDPSLPPYLIRVSKGILYKLWLPYFQNYLINVRKKEPADAFNFILREYGELGSKELEEFDAFLEWFVQTEREEYP
ncbi:MAG: hypothetical protein QW835_00060 [Candidatus Hadarchaeum sp.]